MTVSDRANTVWRVSTLGRVSAATLGALIGGAATGTLIGVVPDGSSGGQAQQAMWCIIVIAGSILMPWLLAFRPSVRLDSTTVTIVNPGKTTRIPLQSARVGGPGYDGVQIVWLDGNRMRITDAWAVQKSNLSTWRGRQTRADRCAAVIAAAIEHSRTDPGHSVHA
jgi:hypothetical protein